MTTLSQTLYQLAQVMESIEENDGIVDEAKLPALKFAETEVSQKIDSYVNFLDAVQAQIDRARDYYESTHKRIKSLENLKNRLKENVKKLMESHNITKLQGNERSIKLCNSGGRAALQNPDGFFCDVEYVNPDYLHELSGLVEARIVHVLRDKEEFIEHVRKGLIPSCSLSARGKYVKLG